MAEFTKIWPLILYTNLMYIPQNRLQYLQTKSSPRNVTIVFGPRGVGKTTLLKKYLEGQKDYLFVSGDDIFVREFLSSNSLEKLKRFIGNKNLLVIDEAQYIPSIGQNLTLILDHFSEIKVIVSGSSTFDLVKHVGEPLIGRKNVLKMFPISQMELSQIENASETQAHLETRLLYGSYPEIITLNSQRQVIEYLHDLVSSYLLKDILAFEGVQKSKKLLDLLILLAFQVGKEVSHNELASQLSMSKTTVERYLDLFEQVFVLVNIRGFSRNLRKEVTKTSRYYFCDNGIRNALINNYNPLSRRDDVGALWENYLVMERIKKQQYLGIMSHNFFWRTYDQKELDWIEEREGKLFGFEFKWGNSASKAPKLWKETYPNSSFECINRDNYLQFIT